MRKEIYRQGEAAARQLLAQARSSTSPAPTRMDGRSCAPCAVLLPGGLCFHGAPAGEKLAVIGRPAVVCAKRSWPRSRATS